MKFLLYRVDNLLWGIPAMLERGDRLARITDIASFYRPMGRESRLFAESGIDAPHSHHIAIPNADCMPDSQTENDCYKSKSFGIA